MTRTVALSQFMPYGAPELQSVAGPYMVRALALGSVCTVALVAAVGLSRLTTGPSPPPDAAFTIVLPAPPVPAPLQRVPPAAVAQGLPKHVAAGVPVPTADAQVAPEATIPSVEEMRAAEPGVGTGGTGIVVEPPAAAEPLPDPNVYVYVEELPVATRRVEPEYPDLAREAGVSGTVLTRVLVGRDGRVLDVRVDERHSIPMLDEAAVAAARRWVFTPAYANGKPVAVWVAVPFAFRLH